MSNFMIPFFDNGWTKQVDGFDTFNHPGLNYITYGNFLLLFGGIRGSGGFPSYASEEYRLTELFDSNIAVNGITFNTLTPKTNSALASINSTCIVVNKHAYVIGGYGSASYNIGYQSDGELDPLGTLNRVTQIKLDYQPTVDGSTAGPTGAVISAAQNTRLTLPFPLARNASCVTRNEVLLLGGASAPSGGNVPVSDVILSSTYTNEGRLDGWKNKGFLPKPLAGGASFVRGNRLYLVGGSETLSYADAYNSGNSRFLTYTKPNTAIYSCHINGDGSLGPWINEGYLQHPFCGGRHLNLGNVTFLFGGNDSSPSFVQALLFDPDTLRYRPDITLRTPGFGIAYTGPRYDFGLIHFRDRIYAFSGYSGDDGTGIFTNNEPNPNCYRAELTQDNQITPDVEFGKFSTKTLPVPEGRFYLPNRSDSNRDLSDGRIHIVT